MGLEIPGTPLRDRSNHPAVMPKVDHGPSAPSLQLISMGAFGLARRLVSCYLPLTTRTKIDSRPLGQTSTDHSNYYSTYETSEGHRRQKRSSKDEVHEEKLNVRLPRDKFGPAATRITNSVESTNRGAISWLIWNDCIRRTRRTIQAV
jgi:hypothetical protein